jgi:hypothetical protein
MASLNYSHNISAKGVAEGLPVRRGSHLYDVEPMQRYPNVLSLGTTQASQFQYGKGVYFRTPHLPITFTIGPYVDNHNADGGNFTRDQHFVIKRGQPVMAAGKRQESIGVFTDDAGVTVEDRSYVDPAKLATNGTIEGFFKPGLWQLKDTNDAGSDADTVITDSEYTALPAEDSSGTSSDTTGEPDSDDYKEVTETDPVAVSRFAALPDAEQENFRAVYSGLEDTNDEIATGGTNLYAEVDEALFEETDMIKNVRVDADDFYFQSASQAQGFIFPSSGGAERTIFYNQVDQEAGVTLPTTGDASRPVAVQPISTSDLSVSNSANWKNSASHVEALPTIGVMHTDLEQAKSQQHHRFSTGTEPRSVVRTGELNIPFIDIDKLQTIVDTKTDLTFGDDFNFVDQSNGQSGFKTGLYNVDAQSGSSDDLHDVNVAGLLTDNDAGYAQLYYNLAAPFMVTKGFPSIQQGVKPDLFGNYVPADAGRIANGSSGSTNFTNDGTPNEYPVDMDALGLGGHVIGDIVEVYDMPRKTLEHLRVNPIFQSRITQGTTKNALNEGHRRLGGTADTGGADQLVSDTAFMLLGGSNYDYFSKLLPQYEDIGQDLSNILEDMIIEGAIGRVEIAFNSVGR